jgi:hypothetical protein
MKRWWLWLIIVIGVIGVGLLTPGVRDILRSPADMVDAVSTGMEIKRLEAMINGFKKGAGRWPTEEEFSQLVTENFSADRSDDLRNDGLVDMWGEPYNYIRHNSGYMVISMGPDRKAQTKDDVILLRRK